MANQVPNWIHHSKKDQKRKLKPQALRQAKARRGALLCRLDKCHKTPHNGGSFFVV